MDNSITMPNSGAPLVGASDFMLVTMKGMDISVAWKGQHKRKKKAQRKKSNHRQIKKRNAKKKQASTNQKRQRKKKDLAKKIEYRKQKWMDNPLVT